MTAHAIGQYLQRYAHSTAHTPWPFPNRRFEHVVVVPAFAEKASFIADALSAHAATSVLLIVVANAPVDAQADDIKQTLTLLESNVAESLQRESAGTDVIWHSPHAPFAVWMIDCVSAARCLPADEGVGLARLIGMDRALAAVARKDIGSPIIYCNDADGLWPANYFDATLTEGDSALTFAFRHIGQDAKQPSQRAYDLRIRDYPASLAAAGSRYGFQALGSAMAVSAEHYAQVRGCPRRAAGEDFHLLAKLAKVGTVRHCPNICVDIHARRSLRVPFGTGRAVTQLQSTDDPLSEPLFYSAHSYRLLQTFLSHADDLMAGPRHAVNHTALSAYLQGQLSRDAHSIDVDVFEPVQAATALARAHDASPDIAQRRRQFHTWFDALRTLRLMHRLRDAGLHNINAHTLQSQHPERYARAQLN